MGGKGEREKMKKLTIEEKDGIIAGLTSLRTQVAERVVLEYEGSELLRVKRGEEGSKEGRRDGKGREGVEEEEGRKDGRKEGMPPNFVGSGQELVATDRLPHFFSPV